MSKGLMRELKRFVKERDRAILSLDVDKFKEFYRKYVKEGFYDMPLPKDDYIVLISMHKMVLALESATEDQKERSLKWLQERGFKAEL